MVGTETIQPFAVAGSAGAVTASPSATAAASATASAHASAQPSGSRSSGAPNPTHAANNGSQRVSADYAAIQGAIGVLFCRYIVNRLQVINGI